MSKPLEPPPDEPREQELSLRGLSEAFAQALCRPDLPPEQEDAVASFDADEGADDESIALSGAEPLAIEDLAASEEACCPLTPRTILEAMLFVDNSGNRPLEARRAAELMRGVEASEIADLVHELNQDYRANQCPYHIVSEGAGYRLALREEFHAIRNKFQGRIREARLSQAAIDVLAIIAYKQPLTADQVNAFRGKPSNHLLAQLIRRRLLRLERPKDAPHKPFYHTTDRFLDLFGLESIDDLPQSEELDRQ
jgi:segregation and condensation protein B